MSVDPMVAALAQWCLAVVFLQARVHKLRAPAVFVDRVRGSVTDDHSAFQPLGIPAMLIIDLEYPYWHTQGDTLDKVSARSLDIVGDTLVESVREIARQADLGKVIED